ncbi:MAG: hypothetical protein QM796_00865 [Chthoniobacteraceae bacterium]
MPRPNRRRQPGPRRQHGTALIYYTALEQFTKDRIKQLKAADQ